MGTSSSYTIIINESNSTTGKSNALNDNLKTYALNNCTLDNSEDTKTAQEHIVFGDKDSSTKMGDRLNDSLDGIEGFCDRCGYISQDFVESGLHALECEGVNERPKDYNCELCKENTTPIWGIETREFCSLVKEAYGMIIHFRPNTYTVPATKVGKDFYDLYADTLEMADVDGTKNHFGWYANMILHPIALQIKDRKTIQKQKTINLKETLQK